MALDQAFASAREALRRGAWAQVFAQLERAHILGQRDSLAHSRAHWLMLLAGWRMGDWREVIGQMPRLLAAVLFSRLWVPFGNNGRARVSAFRPMPVSDELRELLNER